MLGDLQLLNDWYVPAQQRVQQPLYYRRAIAVPRCLAHGLRWLRIDCLAAGTPSNDQDIRMGAASRCRASPSAALPRTSSQSWAS
jgi:hypothetical protein